MAVITADEMVKVFRVVRLGKSIIKECDGSVIFGICVDLAVVSRVVQRQEQRR